MTRLRPPSGTSGSGASAGASSLTPTATKTAAYTAVAGDLAMMNVAGGATTLTLPAAPADGKQVGYRAIGATAAVPLTVTAGGSDTIGLTGATSTTVALADETVVLQYQATGTRWLAVANVKTQTSLDARYAPLEAVNVIAASGAAQTLPDVTTATVHEITLTANCTLTFPALPTGTATKSFEIFLVQDGTGSRLVTWPTMKWGSAAAPVLSTGAGKVDWLVVRGTAARGWVGAVSQYDVR